MDTQHEEQSPDLPPPVVEEIEAEWAAMHCETEGDFPER
jgi:hypothetical protein